MTVHDPAVIAAPWPEMPPYEHWKETADTLLLWTQVVGKVRLALSPHVNHFWNVALYVTTRGLTTSPIPLGTGSFGIDFDFVAHALRITTSGGEERTFALEPMSVADFYRKTMTALAELGIPVTIYARPVERVEAIPFAEDTAHASYDSAAVHAFWRVLVAVEAVFTQFRARFIGKVSPVHLFWGAMDLAVTRFSGRPAPKHPGGVPHCADWVMEDAYSHEVSSAGFWAGAGLGEAAFYSYAYPSPAGFPDWPVLPEAAYFHRALGEFVLPYEAVRTAADPAQALLSFLQTTYEGAATLAHWDRAALDYLPVGGVSRFTAAVGPLDPLDRDTFPALRQERPPVGSPASVCRVLLRGNSGPNGVVFFRICYPVAEVLMVKFSILLVRNPKLTQEQFVEHHKAVHAALFMSIPVVQETVRRYVQQHGIAAEIPGMPPTKYDGVTELWFDDIASLGRCFSDPMYLARVRPDEESFLDLHACDFIVSTENVVKP